jgi:peptidoglycan L-alanyl-D-glutamate endopeptidase CwlK
MKDIRTIERIAMMHPKLRDEVYNIYEDITEALKGNVFCRFTHTLRTFAEQKELFAQGRTKAGNIVTQAREGFSYHNYGLAIDIVLIDGRNASWNTKKDYDADGISDWMEVVQIFKEYGWEWGGDWRFKDAPHFQKTLGYSIRSLHRLYHSGKIDKNNYVLI